MYRLFQTATTSSCRLATKTTVPLFENNSWFDDVQCHSEKGLWSRCVPLPLFFSLTSPLAVVDSRLPLVEALVGMCPFVTMLTMFLGLLLHLFFMRWRRNPKKNQGTQTEALVRSVRTQAQTTYRRHLREPRFHALCERDAGAWID